MHNTKIYIDESDIIFYLAENDTDFTRKIYFSNHEIEDFIDDLNVQLNQIGYELHIRCTSFALPYDDVNIWQECLDKYSGYLHDDGNGVWFVDKSKVIDPDLVRRVLDFSEFADPEKIAEVFEHVKRHHRS